MLHTAYVTTVRRQLPAPAGHRPARRARRSPGRRATSGARPSTATTRPRWRASSPGPVPAGSTSWTWTERRTALRRQTEAVARHRRGGGARRSVPGGRRPAGTRRPWLRSWRSGRPERWSGTAALREPAFVGASGGPVRRGADRRGAGREGRPGSRPGLGARGRRRAGRGGAGRTGGARRSRPSSSRPSSATGCWPARTWHCSKRLVALGRGEIIASAGVASLDDIRATRAVGCGGAIIGRALYEGRIDLAEAVRLAR